MEYQVFRFLDGQIEHNSIYPVHYDTTLHNEGEDTVSPVEDEATSDSYAEDRHKYDLYTDHQEEQTTEEEQLNHPTGTNL